MQVPKSLEGGKGAMKKAHLASASPQIFGRPRMPSSEYVASMQVLKKPPLRRDALAQEERFGWGL